MPYRLKRLLIRIRHWEFWPMNLTYLPVMAYYLYLATKARSFGFFSAVNPGIPYGGMRGEPKYDLLKKLPRQYCPKTVFIPKGTDPQTLLRYVQAAFLPYPLIGKPNIGERGYAVKKINNETDLLNYHQAMRALDFMIQEYIPFREEYAILHYRYPNEQKGRIISVCKKGFLQVVGDGKRTLRQLIYDSPRAFLQYRLLEKTLDEEMETVVEKDRIYPLGDIGNHILGTEFINHNHEIDAELTRVFDGIEQQLDGVCFARYDLRCRSMEDMKQGKHIYIMEINGTGAEAAHIYDTRMGFLDRYKTMFSLWTIMYGIARQNHATGHQYMNLKALWAWKREMDAYYPKILRV